MSYDKIKSISTNEKSMTISITLASSNLCPTMYERMVLKSDTKDAYKDELINVFTNFATGTFKFNASVVNKFSVAYNLAKIFKPELFTYDAYRVDGMLDTGEYTYDIFKKISDNKLNGEARVEILDRIRGKVNAKSVRDTDYGISIKVARINDMSLAKAICWYGILLGGTGYKNVKVVDTNGNEIDLKQLIS